jgi:hypothetical protein
MADLTPDEIEALGYVLDLAHDDQEHYLAYGSPSTDYGSEWPETQAMKARMFRAVASAVIKLGLFHGEDERWESLAQQVEECDLEHGNVPERATK